MAYTTEKLSRTRVAIFKNGEYLCQLQPKEVAGWIARMERSDKADANFAVAQRATRKATAEAYLASRSLRPAAEVQLSLF